ncbi:prenyltransferase [Candidatus Omnitrophota bacterium]
MRKGHRITGAEYARALRLPFTGASILPFIAGSLFAGRLDILNFFLGLCAAVSTHLAANLINDYADSRSGADWQDKRFYGFFGGSKLIQEGALDEKFYLRHSLIYFSAGFLSVCFLALRLKSLLVIGCYLSVIFLAFSYSRKPLQLSYRRLGEAVIFILFGPVPVMGAYFIQTKSFPDPRSFLLSLPFGFFTAAILFANEVPDLTGDLKAGKKTLASLTGSDQAFLLYYLLGGMGFIAIIANVISGHVGYISLFSLLCVPLLIKAAGLLQRYPCDKDKLIESSKLTITLQFLAGLSLIAGVLI